MSKRRGGVGVATYNNFLYAVGGHDAPASNHCSRLSDCVERWVSASQEEEEEGTEWQNGLRVQSEEFFTGVGTGPSTPPESPLVPALPCVLRASTEGAYITVYGAICWSQSYPGGISEISSLKTEISFILKQFPYNNNNNNLYIVHTIY